MHKQVLALILWGVMATGVFAADARPAGEDPELEQRVLRLTNELRCLVCQNQTIADSNAELAVDLRKQVREQLKQGKSEQEILDYMVNRYGDFVLYRPPVKAQTLVLWLGPFVLMASGLFILLRFLRQRRKTEAAAAPEKLDEAARMLRGDRGQS
jgi:cytochrome c-type biogenesis protein CcmH